MRWGQTVKNNSNGIYPREMEDEMDDGPPRKVKRQEILNL